MKTNGPNSISDAAFFASSLRAFEQIEMSERVKSPRHKDYLEIPRTSGRAGEASKTDAYLNGKAPERGSSFQKLIGKLVI